MGSVPKTPRLRQVVLVLASRPTVRMSGVVPIEVDPLKVFRQEDLLRPW